jgi:hypothetical protein
MAPARPVGAQLAKDTIDPNSPREAAAGDYRGIDLGGPGQASQLT